MSRKRLAFYVLVVVSLLALKCYVDFVRWEAGENHIQLQRQLITLMEALTGQQGQTNPPSSEFHRSPEPEVGSDI